MRTKRELIRYDGSREHFGTEKKTKAIRSLFIRNPFSGIDQQLSATAPRNHTKTTTHELVGSSIDSEARPGWMQDPIQQTPGVSFNNTAHS